MRAATQKGQSACALLGEQGEAGGRVTQEEGDALQPAGAHPCVRAHAAVTGQEGECERMTYGVVSTAAAAASTREQWYGRQLQVQGQLNRLGRSAMQRDGSMQCVAVCSIPSCSCSRLRWRLNNPLQHAAALLQLQLLVLASVA